MPADTWFSYPPAVADLPIPELVENRRRSIAMLPVGVPALNRDEALEFLEQLKAGLHELRKLQAHVETARFQQPLTISVRRSGVTRRTPRTFHESPPAHPAVSTGGNGRVIHWRKRARPGGPEPV